MAQASHRPPPSDNSHGDKMAARRPTGEPPAQRRGPLPLHPENGRHPGAGSPAGIAVQTARTDSGPQVREGRRPPVCRAFSRPDPQARAAGLLLRLCAPGSPPVGTRVPAEPGPRPPWGRGGPPAPRETWLLVLVRRRRGHQSPRCDLGEREVAEGWLVRWTARSGPALMRTYSPRPRSPPTMYRGLPESTREARARPPAPHPAPSTLGIGHRDWVRTPPAKPGSPAAASPAASGAPLLPALRAIRL